MAKAEEWVEDTAKAAEWAAVAVVEWVEVLAKTKAIPVKFKRTPVSSSPSQRMRIAIASGKGGTGKTTVATNLCTVLADRGEPATYVDCDVEAPNGHLFLKPQITSQSVVNRLVPKIDNDLCTHCGECARFCEFNAITCLPTVTLVHPELCHSCGGCAIVCPAKAIQDQSCPVGTIRRGSASGIVFVSGTFVVGLANSTPVIRAAKDAAGYAPDKWTIIDSPPGTSCAMMESVKGCDYVILVTEPTPFGLHDLQIAMQVMESLKLPFGVVINRSCEGADGIRKACMERSAPILAEIPNDLEIARAYSRGTIAVRALPQLKAAYEQILHSLAESRNSGRFSPGNPGLAGDSTIFSVGTQS